MAEYQFNDQENEVFASLSRRMSRFGFVFVLIGVVELIQTSLAWGANGYGSTITIGLVKAGYYVFSGAIIWMPSANFKRIASVSGNDVTEVLQAVKKLTVGFGFVQYLQILNILVLLMDIGNYL